MDRDGRILTAASFPPSIRWKPSDIIDLNAGMSYRILERRDDRGMVTLVVEPV